MDNDCLKLYVVKDSTIALYHSTSGTGDKFKGKEFLPIWNLEYPN